MELLREYLLPKSKSRLQHGWLLILPIFEMAVGLLSGSNAGFGIFVIGVITLFMYFRNFWDSNGNKEACMERAIERVAKRWGQAALEADFRKAVPLTQSLRRGEEFIYFSRSPAIFHVSEVKDAKLVVDKDYSQEMLTVTYLLELQLKIGEWSAVVQLNIQPGQSRDEYEYTWAAERVKQWCDAWHQAHSEGVKEAANV